MAADVMDTGQESLQYNGQEDTLQLLKKIPFSDPSLLKPTFRKFGKQLCHCLHGVDDPSGTWLNFWPIGRLHFLRLALREGPMLCTVREAPRELIPCCFTRVNPNRDEKVPPSCTAIKYMTESGFLDKEDSDMSSMTTEGMKDYKCTETASVDNSAALEEASVQCAIPESEKLPQVEDCPSDQHWKDFAEEVPKDSPEQPAPLKGFIPEPFNKQFSHVLYSSCEDYQSWVAEAADVMQNDELLKEKYQAVAAMESGDFPTPLSQAECVSVVMAYELYRTAQSEKKVADFLLWIAQQLESKEGKTACEFTYLTLLGGICFLMQSKYFPIGGGIFYEMGTLVQQAICADDLAVAQLVLNWHPSIVHDADFKGWTPIHLAAQMNAPAMIHILCDKADKKETTTTLGNTPLLIAALAGAEEAVGALLVERADPNVANDEGWTPVQYAAGANNAQMIEMLHQHGGQLHTTTAKGNSPLSLAVMNDSEGAAALLMKKDAKLADWKNTSNWTALHLAASKKAPQMLQILSGYAEVALNLKTNKGHTPLAIATMQNSLQAAEVLLKAKANPGVPNNEGWSALHIAAEQDACDMVHLLCEAGANTEVQTVQGNTPLCIAAMHGHSDSVAELLKQNAIPNARNYHGWSAVHYAAAVNADEMVRQIGQADGADLDVKTNMGNTALIMAITHGSQFAAKVLVDVGADVNVKGPEGWSALHFAVDQDYLEVFEFLCDGGADVNAMCNEHKTPLMLAVMKSSVKAAQALLGIHADPNVKDPNDWSALHMAAESSKTVDILELLVRNRACVEDMTNKGNTALALSVLNNSVPTAKALLLGKADPNICGDHGWFPLHLAAERNYNEMVELLCSFGADPNATNHQGYTPLVISVAKDSKDAAVSLLKSKANPNVRSDLNGWSALHFAAQEDNHTLGELLCDSSADLNARTHEGNPPLLLAAIKKSKSTLSRVLLTLLRRKAEVNACDSQGWTVLHYAAQVNESEIIALFHASSADIEARTDKGNTPLAIAAIYNSGVAAEELLKLGADVNAKNCDDWTPLCCAVYKGSYNLKVIECLCSPANVSMQTQQHGAPEKNDEMESMEDGYLHLPIQLAVMQNQPAVVELLSHYCDAKGITDNNGYTLLHLAANYNSPQAARQLLCDGHYPGKKNARGQYPIHVAALNGSTGVIETYLHHDIGMLSLQDDNGYTVLHCAAMGGQVRVVEMICSNYQGGVNIDAASDVGETPLYLACIFNDATADMIETLCKFGADITISDGYGDTALHFAVLKEKEEKAAVLLSADTKLVDKPGASGEVPLHWAVKKSSSKMIDVLCKGGCDVNAGDQHGSTPLHFATACTRDEAIVKQLLEKGAEPEKSDCEGRTALDFAASQDARNSFMAMHDKAQKAYNIDKVFYNMLRVCEYVKYHQMDKAGRLMSEAIPNVQYWMYLNDNDKNAQNKVTLVGIMNEDSEGISCQPPFKAVLDKCIYGGKVIRRPALFEADSVGHLPGTSGYNMGDGSFLSNLVKRPKLLFATANHPALQAYVSYRWDQIASPFFWRGLLFYLLQLFLLTFAFVSAARPDLPLRGGYRDPIDIFRGICEAAILLITLAKIGIEVFEIVNNRKAYVLDWLNYAQWLSIVLILLIIPLRATAHPGQWVVAAFAYLIFGMQAFEFLIISSYIGVYVETLIIIIWRDIFKFLGVFVVLLVILSGSLYLSLRYDADVANSTTAVLLPGEGSFLHETYFTGLRIMIEAGSILNYYSGPESVFGPLTVILYLLFLFLVVIILLNVLIAQVSETYSAVQSTARATLLFHRSRFITRCEESTVLWFLLWTFRWKMIRSSRCIHHDMESQRNPERTHRKCCRSLRHKVICEEFYCHEDDDAMYWPGQLFHKNEEGKYRDPSWHAKFWRSMESVTMFMKGYVYPSVVSAYEESPMPEQGEMGRENGTEGAAAPDASSIASVTCTVEKEGQEVRSLLASLHEAHAVQSAVISDLQAEIKGISEGHDASMKRLQLQMEDSDQSAAMRDLQAQMNMIAESQDAIVKMLQVQMEESSMSQKKSAAVVAESASDDLQQLELDRQEQQEIQLASKEDSDEGSRSSSSSSI